MAEMPDKRWNLSCNLAGKAMAGSGAAAFNKGEWHHLVGVVNKKDMLLYVNGELEKEQVYNGPMTTGGSETEIGPRQ